MDSLYIVVFILNLIILNLILIIKTKPYLIIDISVSHIMLLMTFVMSRVELQCLQQIKSRQYFKSSVTNCPEI